MKTQKTITRRITWIILSILLISSPQLACAAEPGPLDVLLGFFIAFICLVVIPIILAGVALRKISSNKKTEPDTPVKPGNSRSGYLLIAVAVVIVLGPFLSRYVPLLGVPYDMLFVVILYGFPILIPLALVSLFLAARRRKSSNK